MPAINVESAVISWLNGMLGDGWEAFGDRPKDLPQKYVLVDRTGGPREAMVLDRAEILIEVYHRDSRVEASDKASDIADRLKELLSIEGITRAKVNSMPKLDDLVNSYFRYQIYCDIYNRR